MDKNCDWPQESKHISEMVDADQASIQALQNFLVEKRGKGVTTIVFSNPSEKEEATRLFNHDVAIREENNKKIDELITRCGWPKKSIVGSYVSSMTWLLLQHANITLQEKYLDLVKELSNSGEIRRAEYGYLFDRVQSRNGRDQEYGTQLYDREGKQFLYPISDEKSLDKRRAEIGLEPICSYLANISAAKDEFDRRCNLTKSSEEVVEKESLLCDWYKESNLVLELAKKVEVEGLKMRELQLHGRTAGGVFSINEMSKFSSYQDTITKINEDNGHQLGELLSKCGWPIKSSSNLGLIGLMLELLQYSDINLQEQQLPVLRQFVQSGKLNPHLIAPIEDAVLVYRKGKQLYGTRFTELGGNGKLAPIMEEDKLDTRRNELGLAPLCIFLATSWDGDYEFKNRCEKN